jgi:ribosomal protein S18 acetylase RimI-like enzyme
MTANVGSVGVPEIGYDPSNERVRGWITYEYGTSEFDRQLRESEEMMRDYGATRLTLRAVVPNNAEFYSPFIQEASIPLRNSFEDKNIVYIGHVENRRNPDDVMEYEQHSLGRILNISPRTDALQREMLLGYEISILNPQCQDAEEIAELLETAYTRNGRLIMWYDPTHENVFDVLQNSLTAVARCNDDIISVAVGEIGDPIETAYGQLRICEISDCATHPDYRGRGLSEACNEMLLAELNGMDVVYWETRAPWSPINRVVARCGGEYFGTLPLAVRIGGPRDPGFPNGDPEYEDLYVFAFGTNKSKNY